MDTGYNRNLWITKKQGGKKERTETEQQTGPSKKYEQSEWKRNNKECEVWKKKVKTCENWKKKVKRKWKVKKSDKCGKCENESVKKVKLKEVKLKSVKKVGNGEKERRSNNLAREVEKVWKRVEIMKRKKKK